MSVKGPWCNASLASPAVLYSQVTSTLLDPYRRTRSNLVLTGPLERLSRPPTKQAFTGIAPLE